MLVSIKCLGCLACLHAPDLDTQVGRAGGEERAIGVECDKVYHASVSLHGALVFSLVELPQTDACVFTCTGDNAVVRVNGDFGDFGAMSLHVVLGWLSGELICVG